MKKTNIAIISIVFAVIVFTILTIMQNKIINGKPGIATIVASTEISANSELKTEYFKQVIVPLEIIANTDAITSISDIEGMYSRENINKGQILFKQDIDSKEKLKILEEKNGLERIAIKIKSSENGVAYQIKPKDKINLYFSGRYGMIKETINQYNLPDVPKNDNSMYTLSLLRDLEVLGVYDIDGRSVNSEKFSGTDTVIIATDSRNIEIINNLRTQGTFDITR